MNLPKLRQITSLLTCSSIALASLSAAAEPHKADIVVYGGTSGAVVSAVQAKRLGKSVIIVSPDKHLGGLTSGGLGWTDIGDNRILGGISKEFYQAVYHHYQNDTAWDLEPRNQFGNRGQRGPAMDHERQVMSVFEPKVAETIFNNWIKEHDIPVIHARLDRSENGITMDGTRITTIRTLDGHQLEAKFFIDATYEGDLMDLAGVSFTTGREANAQYNETINGIQTRLSGGNQLPSGIDPYVVEGDPNSGLLPGVNPDAGGKDGEGDHRIQAYCYRMCLTDHEPNRRMVEKPENYNEDDYELLFRAIAAGQRDRFFKTTRMPNFKTDSNNDAGLSTDYIGYNYDYPTGSYETRETIAKAHKYWQLGLIWTLQNHERVPEDIRKTWGKWGLPKDEFVDTDNWPHALYVREARRMVSDFVMTQNHITLDKPVTQPIGMGAYTMDSHHVQRHVDANGHVRNEGDVQVRISSPYSIDYRAIIPPKSECTNLFVTFALSSSHMAFGSIRMEPVFMALSESAASAAAIAIDNNLSVQDVPYPQLRSQLLKDGQRLTLDDPETELEISAIIDHTDNDKVITTGEWTASVSVKGFHGTHFLHDNNEAKGEKSIRFSLPITETATHTVYIRWTSHENRATNTPVTITHADGTKTITVNQRNDGGQWIPLGNFNFSPNKEAHITISNKDTNGFVIADAVAIGTPKSED